MKIKIFYFLLTFNLFEEIDCTNRSLSGNDRNYMEFLNFGTKKLQKSDKINSGSEIHKTKIDALGNILRKYIDTIKSYPKLEIVFLIDSSSSIGENNFKSELRFVKKLLSDVVVDYNHTRIAVVAFSSPNNILKNVDEIGSSSKTHNKCSLLTKQLRTIQYKGGETFTLGALNEAKDIFMSSNRNDSKKVIFLITDGYSNGGDPIPVANELKQNSVTIFTIGIQNGNYKELFEISSDPGEYYSYLLDSFNEFENLARRALHSDLKNGDYYPLGNNDLCNDLCLEGNCCDSEASCSCGTTTGHYSCVCKPGFYGTGLKNNCHPCVSGTYSNGPNACLPCPDPFHTTAVPAVGIQSCKCKEGYKSAANNKECKELKCHKISAPQNGYYVKNKVCPNVMFSACGIRCEVGYTLTGTSVRLCQKNGTWSGLDPQCQIKTCGPLEVPKGGKIECFQFDTKKTFENLTELPVDTVCKFVCNAGYILSGSKERICLPIARWTGLKTICKPIRCKKLTPINFGSIEPSSCKNRKQEYGKVCRFSCDDGFILQGPKERRCGGQNGAWEHRKEKTTCIDITPPKIICPSNLVVSALPGKKYGHADWTDPIVTDNSNGNVSVWLNPAIENKQSFKFEIGVTKVFYFAQDVFQNQAYCSFEITVEDIEAPYFENCESPPTFLTNNPKGANVTWDEPFAFDNSQHVMVIKSHEFGFFGVGSTSVTYTAFDNYNNSNVCSINVTIEVSKCEPLPDPPNGQSVCLNQTEGVHCLITCKEGYSIPITQVAERDDGQLFVCNHAYPVWYSDDAFTTPECSVTHVAEELLDGEFIISDINNCDDAMNIETLKNDVKHFIKTEICTENCTIDTKTECHNGNREILKKESNLVKREATQRKHRNRLNVKYHVRQKYHNANKNFSNSQIQLRSGHRATTHYKTKITCAWGFVQRGKRCVRCPKGTFHNETRNVCQKCSFGQYNDKIGQTSCIQCPLHYSTGKMRSKKLTDCKEQCPPGTHARKKLQTIVKRFQNVTIEKTTLKPHCSYCEIGYYQPDYGNLECFPCPAGYTTTTVGSTSMQQCVTTSEEICKRNGICSDGICTIINNYEYTCNCLHDHIGTHCEQYVNLCQSQPCYNDGHCSYSDNKYNCSCKHGYTGDFCEYVMEIRTKKCLNNGIYYIEDDGNSTCICPPQYYGELCENELNICDEITCENNSTCIGEGGQFYCKCFGGFIGMRCHLLPCDYKPCNEQQICVNTFEENSTRDNYRCVCPEGYIGANCDEKINYCLYAPCLNGGTCHDGSTNYTCQCSSLFSGINCEIRRNNKYVLNFRSYSTNNFVKLRPFSGDLSEISVCLWIQTLDDTNYGTIISYATESYDNAFTLTDYTGLVIYVNNQYIVTDTHLNDGLWHHLCVTWTSLNGTYEIFVDAKLVTAGFNLSLGNQIEGRGSFVLGQDQDIVGGGFSQSESFVGKLTEVDIWYKHLTHEDIETHFIRCQDSFFGDLYAWPEMQDFTHGNILVEKSDFCKKCEAPKTLFNGFIDVVDEVAYYSCYPGFVLNNSDFGKGRKCTKASYWEGYYEPFCRRLYCGYPGSIRNGYLIGKKYSFQDEVSYNCYDGYQIIGNRTMVCNEHGQWFPDKPRCMGTQCALFEKPQNSELMVLSDQSYEDHAGNQTSFDVGTQIEIICDANHKIVGDNLSTCTEEGVWDFPPPKCLPNLQVEPKKIGCSLDQIPEAPPNGYVDMESYNQVSNGTRNVVEYKCKSGYKLVGHNSTSCIIDGYWSEPKMSCELITCGVWPKFKNTIPVEDTRNLHRVGDKVSFNCIEGYDKLGSSLFIRCLPSGKWSRLQGKCLRKSCGKPILEDDMRVDGKSYLFGDSVRIFCKNGSNYTLVCDKNGSWSGEEDVGC